MNASGTYSQNITLNGDVTVNCTSGTVFINGVISGTGSITKTGSSQLQIQSVSTYTGSTTVSAGYLVVARDGSISSTSSVQVASGAQLSFDTNADATFNKVISGTGNLVFSSPRNYYLTANNTFTGTTTIQGSANLYLGNGGTLGAIEGTISVINNSSLIFNRSYAHTHNGVITGAGRIEKIGANVLTLGGVNTFTNQIIITAGTLAITNASALGTTTTQNVPAGATLSFVPSANMTFSRVISGAGNVLIAPTDGNVTFSAANTYTGTTTVTSGWLSLGETGSIATSSSVILNGGELQLGGDKTIRGLSGSSAVRLNAHTLTLSIATGSSHTFSGIISGTGGLRNSEPHRRQYIFGRNKSKQRSHIDA